MKRLVALGVTLAILGAILASVDRAALLANVRATRPIPFAIAMFLFLPQNALIVWRWMRMASPFTPMPFRRAASLILAGQSMNILLPSKLGDLAKAWFLVREGALDSPRAIHLVVFEKLLDLASLSFLAMAGVAAAWLLDVEGADSARFRVAAAVCLAIATLVVASVGWLYFAPGRATFHDRSRERLAGDAATGRVGRILGRILGLAAGAREIAALLRERGARRSLLAGVSLALWALHLLQIRFFFECLGADVPALAFASLMPLAIFVGLLPLALFGMGTRDAAILFLFAAWAPPETLAAVGLYVSLRYAVPALAGLPFLNAHLAAARAMKR